MMSAHDSVSTVYKCMLRGAADFLVKPVRKNELKNLWQHVWRRQASSSGGPQAASDAQQKVEAMAENNATSSHSSGYEACIQRNQECIEKGSDAQSSCTKPDLEAEGADMEHKQDLTRPKHSKSLSSETKIQKGEECVGSERVLMHDSEAQGSTATPKNANLTTSRGDSAANSNQERANVTTEAFDNDGVRINYSREAIDLIGAFDTYPKCSFKSSGSNYGATSKVDYSSLLDLSLRRSHPSGSVNQVMNDRNRLKQSDASAFSRRYISRTFQPLHSTSTSICNQQRGYKANSDRQLSHQALDYKSDTRGSTVTYDNNMISLTTGQREIQVSCPLHKATPVTVPVRDTRVESESTAYSKVMPPVFCTQSSQSPSQSPGSSGRQDPSFQVDKIYPFNPETSTSQQLHYLMDQNIHNAYEQTEHKKRQKLDPLDDRGYFSSATDQSGSGSFCNHILNRFNSINSGSSGNFNTVPVVVTAEYGNEATLIHDGNCHRSIQREAALTKFRMKRKDRCYEKRVRYESRRKLAEQRPRVKGQFVRQVQTESPSVETDNQLVTSLTS